MVRRKTRYCETIRNKLHNKQIEIAHVQETLTHMNVENAVRESWNTAVVGKMKYKLAVELDSIYSQFERAAQLRYKTEATSKLEWLMAKNQAHQIKIEKQEAEVEYQKKLLQLQYWTQTDVIYDVPTTLSESQKLSVEKIGIANHPLLISAQKDSEAMQAAVKVEKAGLLPKLNLQYGKQKVGSQTGYYSYQAGISFPLWNRPQRGKIKAAKVSAQITSLNQMDQEMKLNKSLSQATKDYLQKKSAVEYFESEALDLADEQIKGAQLAYKSGELDYLQFSRNLEEAMIIKQKYLDNLNDYLTARNRVQYLSNNY